MESISYGRYSKEFREEAVNLVMEGGKFLHQVARELCLLESTPVRWVKSHKSGKIERLRSTQPPLTDIEEELAHVTQERDILK